MTMEECKWHLIIYHTIFSHDSDVILSTVSPLPISSLPCYKIELATISDGHFFRASTPSLWLSLPSSIWSCSASRVWESSRPFKWSTAAANEVAIAEQEERLKWPSRCCIRHDWYCVERATTPPFGEVNITLIHWMDRACNARLNTWTSSDSSVRADTALRRLIDHSSMR